MLYARHRIQAKFYHQTGLVKRNSPCQIRQFPDGEGHFRRGLLTSEWIITPIVIGTNEKKLKTVTRLRAFLDGTQKLRFEPRV